MLSLVVLPSGSVGSLNFKFLFLITTISLFIYFLRVKGVIQKKTLGIFLVTGVALLVGLFCYMSASNLAVMYGYNVDEFKAYIIYFITTPLLLALLIEEVVPLNFFVKYILWSSLAYSCIKILITILVIFNVVSIFAVTEFILRVFEVKPMTIPILGNLYRLQLANDFVIAFCLYFTILFPQEFYFKNNISKFLVNLILIMALIISFSRYMFVLLIIALFIKIFFVGVLNFKKIMSLFFGSLLCSLVYIYNYDFINDLIVLRFSSDASDSSDGERSIQISCLMDGFNRHPMLGNGGFGDFSQLCPGPDIAKASYEVQYIGMLYKHGLIVTLLILFLYFLFYKVSINGAILNIQNRYCTLAVICWMMIGFMNPYLISSYGTVIVFLSTLIALLPRRDMI